MKIFGLEYVFTMVVQQDNVESVQYTIEFQLFCAIFPFLFSISLRKGNKIEEKLREKEYKQTHTLRLNRKVD